MILLGDFDPLCLSRNLLECLSLLLLAWKHERSQSFLKCQEYICLDEILMLSVVIINRVHLPLPQQFPTRKPKNKTFETDFRILVSIFSLGQQQHLVVQQLILTNDVIEL